MTFVDQKGFVREEDGEFAKHLRPQVNFDLEPEDVVFEYPDENVVAQWNDDNPDARFEVAIWGGRTSVTRYLDAYDKRTGAKLLVGAIAAHTTMDDFVKAVEAEYRYRDSRTGADQIQDIEVKVREFGTHDRSTAAIQALAGDIRLHTETQRHLLGFGGGSKFPFSGDAIEEMAQHPDLTPESRERLLKGSDSSGWVGLAKRRDLTAKEMRSLCVASRPEAAKIVMQNMDPMRVGGDMRATVLKVAQFRTDKKHFREARNEARIKIQQFLILASDEEIIAADLPLDVLNDLEPVEAYGQEWLEANGLD